MKIQAVRKFRQENGSYLLVMHLISYCSAGMRNHLISRKLGIRKIKIGSRAYLRGLSAINMGEDFSAGSELWLEAITKYNDQLFAPRIVIGNQVRASHFVHIAATHLVEIGDNVLMGSGVMITDHNHGNYSRSHTSPHIPPALRPLDCDRQVVIEKNVWLGNGVVVTPGAFIGEGSIIAANSVVIGNIPPFAIAAGAPATVRKVFNFDTGKWGNIE
jgi:lipopolysaccharide O-acetyltransferase